MSKTAAFLESLNDIELSFLYKYRYQSYLAHSQSLVQKEIQRRGLTDEMMDEHVILTEFNKMNTGCTRCNSSKRLTKEVERYAGMNTDFIDSDTHTTDIECVVCGYTIYSGNNELTNLRRLWNIIRRMIKK